MSQSNEPSFVSHISSSIRVEAEFARTASWRTSLFACTERKYQTDRQLFRVAIQQTHYTLRFYLLCLQLMLPSDLTMSLSKGQHLNTLCPGGSIAHDGLMLYELCLNLLQTH